MVTSSIGLEIVADLHARGEKIIWAPDRHLGGYIQKKTGADMLLWQGSCLVHDEFKGIELDLLRGQYPDLTVSEVQRGMPPLPPAYRNLVVEALHDVGLPV